MAPPAGQLQLAKSHGLPAFKITPNPAFDASLRPLLASGAPLTSAALRGLLAPAATAGLNAAKAGRGLQEEFDGAVACLKGLLAAYEDLALALSDVARAASDSAGKPPSEALAEVRALLGGRQHALPFEESGGALTPTRFGSAGAPAAASSGEATGGERAAAARAPAGAVGGVPLLEAAKSNAGGLAARLAAWESLVKSHQAPSRVVKWAT
jgi:hypothetical protein